MNAEQAANAKPIIALMEAVRGIIRRDVSLGLYEEPQLKLAIEDRKLVVAELKAQGRSNREIARVLGVDEGTVRNDSRAENSAGELKKAIREKATQELNAENSADEFDDAGGADSNHRALVYRGIVEGLAPILVSPWGRHLTDDFLRGVFEDFLAKRRELT